MKKLFLSLVALAALGLAPAMADQNTYFKSGSLVAEAGLGINAVGLVGLGGADYSLGQFELAPIFPLDYGVGARGALVLGSGGIGIGFGAYGVAGYSLKALKLGIGFVDNIETKFGLGLDYALGGNFEIGYIDTWTYHFDRKLAVELGYYSLSDALVLGVTYALN